MSHAVGHESRVLQSLSIGQEYLYGKLVAVGEGEEAHLQHRHDEQRGGYRGQAHAEGYPRVPKRLCENAVIEALHAVCEPLPIGFLLRHTDNPHTQIGDNGDRQQQRYHEVDGDSPGEVLQRIVEGPFERDEERIEDGADADRGKHHRHEILRYRLHGGLFRLDALAHIFQIAVNDHDGVIDYHSKHHDESCQRDDVQGDVGEIHECHRDERAQRNGDGSHDGRPQREEYHHHEDDDHHRKQQIAQEVADAIAHHLRLISNARQRDIVGQLVLPEVVEHAVHIDAVGHDVVARRHLER